MPLGVFAILAITRVVEVPGFAHPAIGSWSYPEAAVTELGTAPVYSGFMYAVAFGLTGPWA